MAPLSFLRESLKGTYFMPPLPFSPKPQDLNIPFCQEWRGPPTGVSSRRQSQRERPVKEKQNRALTGGILLHYRKENPRERKNIRITVLLSSFPPGSRWVGALFPWTPIWGNLTPERRVS